MLYSGTKEEQVFTLLAALDLFAKDYGLGGNELIVDLRVDSAIIGQIVYAINDPDFPHCDGSAGASAFKKAAFLMTQIISLSPITGVVFSEDLDSYYLSSHILQDYNPNAVFALHLSLALIEDHSMERTDSGQKHASDITALTKHSYNDILSALSTLKICPKEHYSLIALLLEQLFYKTNPKSQYDDFFCGSKKYIELCKLDPEHYADLIDEDDPDD